jgi:hypothetical protein
MSISQLTLSGEDIDLILQALEGYAAVISLAKHPDANKVRQLAENIQAQA